MLRVKKLVTQAKLPSRATVSSAGYDLYSAEEKNVPPHEVVSISTGIALSIPEGHYGRIASRSSLAKLGLDTRGGVIDSDYRGEVKVLLYNSTERDFLIKKEERIAQLILEKISLLPVEEVETLSETERGQGGFGSTGK